MPDRVHAILVVRPDGRTPAEPHLRRTLTALRAQARPVDALTIVVCGQDARLAALLDGSGAEGVLSTSAATSYAQAVRLGALRVPDDAAVWLLAQDTAPAPDALAALAGALELAPSLALAAPKLVRADDRDTIVSLGRSMTGLGRAVTRAAGELDQGQHDTDEDVLGADVRGLLVAADAWRTLGGIDPGLGGADEGLDLGVRARLTGRRVAVVPGARVAVAGDGVAGPGAARGARGAYRQRRAQLHRRLVYARLPAVALLWLGILPLQAARTVWHLVVKRPGAIVPEWGAAAVATVRLPAVAAARRRIRTTRIVPWALLDPLRVSRAELRRTERSTADGAERRTELRFFSGGGAWTVLAALVVSTAAFAALLAWPVLGGGALLPLRTTVAQLWSDAAWGLRGVGSAVVGPADPFAGVVAVLGSLSPAQPSTALVVLWVLALPLAVLGGWFAATRVTERSALRALAGVAWALAPAFLAALVQGRPTAVLAHLLLPWLLYAGAVAHRSWAAAAAASLLFAATLACAPVLAAPLVVLWLAALIAAASTGRGRGATRVGWVVVPAVALAAPLVWRQLALGNAWGLLADPGVPWAGPQVAAGSAGRLLLAAGFPTADAGGWGALVAGPVWWVLLLVAPLGLLALLAPATRRWAAGAVLLAMAALGLATAFGAVGVAVGAAQSLAVPIWPGTALSLAWAGAVGAGVVTLDDRLLSRRAAIRPVAVAVVLGCLAVLSVPQLTALARDRSQLTGGPASTLPAYVAAEGRDDPDVGTLVLTPQNSGGVSARVIWGSSESLGGESTLVATRVGAAAADRRIATLTADLIASSSPEVVTRLAGQGMAFVLLAPAAHPESDAARAVRLHAVTSIDQREAFVPVGATARGTLWRVAVPVADRAGLDARQQRIAGWVTAGQLTAIAVALLLAVPTAASRRAARRLPRVVGERDEDLS